MMFVLEKKQIKRFYCNFESSTTPTKQICVLLTFLTLQTIRLSSKLVN